MKRIKLWLLLALVVGFAMGYVVVLFVRLLGANIILPSSIFEIYGTCIFLSEVYTIYKILTYEGKKEDAEKQNKVS